MCFFLFYFISGGFEYITMFFSCFRMHALVVFIYIIINYSERKVFDNDQSMHQSTDIICLCWPFIFSYVFFFIRATTGYNERRRRQVTRNICIFIFLFFSLHLFNLIFLPFYIFCYIFFLLLFFFCFNILLLCEDIYFKVFFF